MTARVIAPIGVLVVVLVTAFAVTSGGEKPYRLNVPLDNASGLENGSAVVVGSITRGKVRLELDRDRVTARLDIDRSAGPVGRDARVTVSAANFLGQKRVELDPGDTSRPLPSGSTISASRVTTPTDLDQVLAVLDADTRTRVKILLDEAGEAVLGRRVDVAEVLEEFPAGMRDATRVLEQIEADDKTIRDVLVRSDRFLAEVGGSRRADLGRMVEAVGETAETIAARRRALGATLSRAPGMLASLRHFLADLRETTVPLRPTARAISDTAPSLARTLDGLAPFTEAARPSLATAESAAPELTRLADDLTPVLRRAVPTVRSLDQLAGGLPPLTEALDHSYDNILAVVENWSRAIQFRDGLSHVFRGEASFTPNVLEGAVERLAAALAPKAKSKSDRRAPRETLPVRPRTPRPPSSSEGPAPKPKLPKITELPTTITELPPAIKKALDETLDALSGNGPRSETQQGMNGLLDFLLAP